MIIEIGLCYALYNLGERIYRSLSEDETDAGDEENAVISMVSSPDSGVFEKETPLSESGQDQQPWEDPEEACQGYVNSSLVSMGMFALAPLFGPLGIFPYFYGMLPYAADVKRALVDNRKINADVLFFLADMLTLSTGRFFTAAFGLYLIHAGKLAVIKAKDNSRKLVMHLFEELPEEVLVIDAQGNGIRTSLEEVRKGDVIAVGAGEVIPVDGVVIQGMASVDQHALTGESQPSEKGAGDAVLANTIVIAGSIRVCVERSGFDTTSYQVAEMLFKSVSFKSDIQLKGEEWADRMTLPMLAAAGVALPIMGPVPTAVLINGHIGVRIRLLGPLGTLKHISLASQQGILVKDGRALEKLHLVDTVLFDKTGTLTTGEPEVINVMAAGGWDRETVLRYAAAAEGKQSHPIARAIVREAESRGIDPLEIQDAAYTIGYGIQVQAGEHLIRVGSDRFFADQGMALPETIRDYQDQSLAMGNIVVLVGIDSEVAGAIELQPRVQDGMAELIAKLKNRGIRNLAIVSGDHELPTKRLAGLLGMDDYYCNILPQDKAGIVKALQEQGRTVCFIGDGINDSMALKQADVSISLAGATTIARDMAEIIFMDGSVAALDNLVDLSVQLDRNLRQSLNISLVPSVVNIAGAFLLNFDILTALLVNVGCNVVGMRNVMPPAQPLSAQEQMNRKSGSAAGRNPAGTEND